MVLFSLGLKSGKLVLISKQATSIKNIYRPKQITNEHHVSNNNSYNAINFLIHLYTIYWR